MPRPFPLHQFIVNFPTRTDQRREDNSDGMWVNPDRVISSGSPSFWRGPHACLGPFTSSCSFVYTDWGRGVMVMVCECSLIEHSVVAHPLPPPPPT